MYKVIIVDDENWVVESLKKGIAWSDFGFQVIDQASDGVKALEKIRRLKPDLVFTDIRMPEMSGLDLIRQIRSERLPVEFVVVSGYAEFAYAQKALQYRVMGFCVKPAEDDEVNAVLQRVKAVLDSRNTRDEAASVGTAGAGGSADTSSVPQASSTLVGDNDAHSADAQAGVVDAKSVAQADKNANQNKVPAAPRIDGVEPPKPVIPDEDSASAKSSSNAKGTRGAQRDDSGNANGSRREAQRVAGDGGDVELNRPVAVNPNDKAFDATEQGVGSTSTGVDTRLASRVDVEKADSQATAKEVKTVTIRPAVPSADDKPLRSWTWTPTQPQRGEHANKISGSKSSSTGDVAPFFNHQPQFMSSPRGAGYRQYFWYMLNTYNTHGLAREAQEQLQARGVFTYIYESDSGYSLSSTPFESRAAAEAHMRELRAKNIIP